jgi:hypothetical protein
MDLHLGLAAAATLLSTAFALSTFERWLDRRRRYELAWTVALVLFAAGSAALWAGAALGWSDLAFRLFYLFGAVVNVPVLALGTVLLLASARAGRWATTGVLLFAGFGAGVVLAAPLTRPIAGTSLPQGSDVFGPLPRALAAVGSAGGAMVVLGGAVWSAVRLARRHAPGTRGLVVGNALIAAGTLVLGAGGILNSAVDAMDAFSISLVAGIALVFAGFVVASARPAVRAAGSRPGAPRTGTPVRPRLTRVS